MCIAVLLTCAAPLNAQEGAAWQAGVAKVAITPRQPMWMSGYAARTKPAEGKVHDLWAKALVLQDARGKRCALVTMDLVGIDRGLADALCDDLATKFGLERAGIMLSVSHTHCGPVVGNNLRAMYDLDAVQQQLVTDYTKELRLRMSNLVAEALRGIKPAELSWATGLTTFATNRRNNKEVDVPKLRELGRLQGPVDHEVPVLAVRDPGGKLRAVVFGYACHATVLSFYQWCGDYPGFAQLELEKRHPDATALFFAGCGADQNPLPRRTVELADAYGRQLAEAVHQVLQAPMKSIEPAFANVFARIDLPFAVIPTRDKLLEDTMNKDKYIAGRAKLLLKEFEKTGSLRNSYPYPVQTWQLGRDLTWVALGGEVVVDYSLRLKKELGRIWVSSYANDVMAYIPSLRVLKEGGYEGDTSMIYYGQPSAWGPEIEERIVGAVRQQVMKMRVARQLLSLAPVLQGSVASPSHPARLAASHRWGGMLEPFFLPRRGLIQKPRVGTPTLGELSIRLTPKGPLRGKRALAMRSLAMTALTMMSGFRAQAASRVRPSHWSESTQFSPNLPSGQKSDTHRSGSRTRANRDQAPLPVQACSRPRPLRPRRWARLRRRCRR
jgi:hypothetical protein